MASNVPFVSQQEFELLRTYEKKLGHLYGLTTEFLIREVSTIVFTVTFITSVNTLPIVAVVICG